MEIDEICAIPSRPFAIPRCARQIPVIVGKFSNQLAIRLEAGIIKIALMNTGTGFRHLFSVVS